MMPQQDILALLRQQDLRREAAEQALVRCMHDGERSAPAGTFRPFWLRVAALAWRQALQAATGRHAADRAAQMPVASKHEAE